MGDEDPVDLGPRAHLAAGVGLVPEDRKRQGLVLGLNCRENTCLAALPSLTTLGWVKRTAEQELAAMPEVRIIRRGVVFGYHDGNFLTIRESLTDHLPLAQRKGFRERLWRVRAVQVVLDEGLAQPILVGRPAVIDMRIERAGLRLYDHVLMIWVWEKRWGSRKTSLPARLLHKTCGHHFVPVVACSAVCSAATSD